MFDAHVFAYGDREFYASEWDEWLRLRYEAYVLERQWMPPNDEKRETDEFDTDRAVYVLGLDAGSVVASARLIPSIYPTMVSEHYADMCEIEPVPRYPDWIDWSRTLIAKDRRRQGTIEVLCTAVMEYCLHERAAWVGGLQENFHMPRWQWLQWQVKALGLPRPMHNSEDSLVAYMKVSREALDNARAFIGISDSLLHNRGPWPVLIPEPRP